MSVHSLISKRMVTGGLVAVAIAAAGSWTGLVQAQAPTVAKGVKYSQVSPTDLKDWLTYLASDQLTGRPIGAARAPPRCGRCVPRPRVWA